MQRNLLVERLKETTGRYSGTLALRKPSAKCAFAAAVWWRSIRKICVIVMSGDAAKSNLRYRVASSARPKKAKDAAI